jgi:lipopolysaccharide/colanic/teichoic acid biosynthesis glycosyltransferase
VNPEIPATAPIPVVKQPIIKRLIDVVVASIGLVLTAPLSLVISIATKMEDRGPVFYTQERWGRGGNRFRLLKYRTMHEFSDRDHGITQAAKIDDRVTRVGRVLRSTGMDEIPQFINILKGDMSFVGPRALAVGELLTDEAGQAIAYEKIPGFTERLAVRPGLTGMATIYIPKDSPPLKKLEYDLRYIEEQSVWLDIKLIALSIWISVRGNWESRQSKF